MNQSQNNPPADNVLSPPKSNTDLATPYHINNQPAPIDTDPAKPAPPPVDPDTAV